MTTQSANLDDLFPMILRMAVLANQWSQTDDLGTYGHLRFNIYRFMSSVGQWCVDGMSMRRRYDLNQIGNVNILLRLFFDIQSIFEDPRQ